MITVPFESLSEDEIDDAAQGGPWWLGCMSDHGCRCAFFKDMIEGMFRHEEDCDCEGCEEARATGMVAANDDEPELPLQGGTYSSQNGVQADECQHVWDAPKLHEPEFRKLAATLRLNHDQQIVLVQYFQDWLIKLVKSAA